MNEENNRTILNNVLVAFFVRGGAIIISFLTLPAYIRYFDNQQILGMWFTILSVLMWVLTFDLGIGNGLRNNLVRALVAKDEKLAKNYISSAYIIIGILVLLVLCISTVIFRFINWNTFFNIPINLVSKETLYITVCIVFGGIMLQFLFMLITSILYAMQKSAVISLLSLLSSIIILAYVSLASSADISTNLISLAFVHVLAVNIPLLLTNVIVFSTKLKNSKPNIKYFGKKYAKEVILLGGIFFWVQIMYMLITATNEFLITWLSGPEMVVEYQIYNKLFTLIGTIFTLVLTPVWSAVTKALAEKKYVWIKKLYKTLFFMALLAVFCEFAMIPFLQVGINLWLGESIINVNYLYAVVFAISGSVFIWNGVLSSI
ncbi:lipopolysaccharide biosynthesis protein, partial [Psychrobacillus sp. FJAT-21963]|uniref:lipopolysaccharide biosynthesis protein n=1 Tax=Psychrobacillus sp. FJAT-21963 TaxID=1712028 RepID=UPI0006FE4FBB